MSSAVAQPAATPPEELVLVINCGSSSIKFQVVDPGSAHVHASGLVERIGEAGHPARVTVDVGGSHVVSELALADHGEGLDAVLKDLRGRGLLERVQAVGHRVVHGGEVFYEPTLIDDEVIATIEDLSSLAPLHNPANLRGIRSALQQLATLPQVAVFDTAFFHGLPAWAYTYAIDSEVALEYGIRRYGFHGTSHEFVSRAAADFLGKQADEVNLIVFHLGNGASAAAIRAGAAIDTTMGFTPLEGLVMGTRSGDIDPGVLFYLERSAEMTVGDLDRLLNRRSGVLGLAGVNDFRELQELIDDGDQAAELAYAVYLHRLRKYLGAYLIELDGEVDAIVFTAGVGEHSSRVRADALAGLLKFGIEVDAQRNTDGTGLRDIATAASSIRVLVVPTNEELAIAQATQRVAGLSS